MQALPQETKISNKHPTHIREPGEAQRQQEEGKCNDHRANRLQTKNTEKTQ